MTNKNQEPERCCCFFFGSRSLRSLDLLCLIADVQSTAQAQRIPELPQHDAGTNVYTLLLLLPWYYHRTTPEGASDERDEA